MSRKPVERPNPYFTFLRRLRAGGRSNMYGAIPYLTTAFGCNREEAFRIVCEWIDAQTESDSGHAVPAPAQTTAVRPAAAADAAAPRARKSKSPAPRSRRKASRRKAA